MANVKFTDLPAAATIVGDELAAVVQGGDSVKVAISDLAPGFAGTLTGTQAAVLAQNAVIGGLPQVFMVAIADGASGDTDVTLTHKTRVLDAWVILKAAGNGGNTYTVKSTANAITDAITPGATDTTLARAAQINDANYEIPAAGVLRVSHVRAGGSSLALVCVLGVRVA